MARGTREGPPAWEGLGKSRWDYSVCLRYGMLTVNCPGTVMLITPPHVHMSLEVLLSAGEPFIMTVGAPVTQGAVVTGMQGWGVSTPEAAAVAAATCGFVGVVHMPKGGTFAMGA